MLAPVSERNLTKMKRILAAANLLSHSAVGARVRRILTLTAVFSLAGLAGLYSSAGSRPTADAGAGPESDRSFVNRFNDEIRSSKALLIGKGDSTSFTAATAHCPQQGNALRIYPQGVAGPFILYYVDVTDRMLKRVVGASTETEVCATGLSTDDVFFGEDSTGKTLKGGQVSRTVRMTLELIPMQKLAPTQLCRVQTRATRRVVN